MRRPDLLDNLNQLTSMMLPEWHQTGYQSIDRRTDLRKLSFLSESSRCLRSSTVRSAAPGVVFINNRASRCASARSFVFKAKKMNLDVNFGQRQIYRG